MNVSFEYSKTLAMEGSILMLLSLVPYVGLVLGIIGVILLIRAMKEFSNYYQDDDIYKNSLAGVKFYIIALIAIAVAIAAIVIGIAFASEFTFTSIALPTISFGAGLISFFAGLVIAFVFFILASSRLRKAFNTLSEKSGEASFTTAGTLLWWGSIFTIVFGIGLIIIFISWIFVTVGFFTMKSKQYQQYNPQQNSNGYTSASVQPRQ